MTTTPIGLPVCLLLEAAADAVEVSLMRGRLPTLAQTHALVEAARAMLRAVRGVET